MVDGTRKPRPADFDAVHAANPTIAAIRRHYGIGKQLARLWMGRETAEPSNAKPLPDDYVASARHLHTAALCAQYGVSDTVVRRWAKMTGQWPSKCATSHNSRPVPDDFAQIAPTMTIAEMQRHYNAHWDGTVRRWMRETGIAAKKPRYNPQNNFRPQRGSGQIIQLSHNRSMFDDAADVLRRERFAVYRCDDRGRAMQQGAFWRVGNVICTPDELLMRADRKRSKAA